MKSHGRANGRARNLTGGMIGAPTEESILFQIARCCPTGRLIAPEAGRNSINSANKFITLSDKSIYIVKVETGAYKMLEFFFSSYRGF